MVMVMINRHEEMFIYKQQEASLRAMLSSQQAIHQQTQTKRPTSPLSQWIHTLQREETGSGIHGMIHELGINICSHHDSIAIHTILGETIDTSVIVNNREVRKIDY